MLALNSHTLDVLGSFTGGAWSWRYVSGEYTKFSIPPIP